MIPKMNGQGPGPRVPGALGVRGILLLGLLGPLAAAEPLTLARATERALAGNPTLLAAKLEAVAARQRTLQSAGRHLGDVDLVGQYNHYDQDRLLAPISRQLLPITQLPFDRNQVHYGLAWQVPLLAGGSLREGDRMARLSQEATEHLALHGREEVRFNVRAAYWNALVARHRVKAAEAFEGALEEDHRQARLLVATGRWAEVDAAKVDYALQEARAGLAGLQAGESRAQAVLAALMGEDPPAEPFVLEDQEAPGDSAAPAEDSLRREALADRSDLKAAKASTAVAEAKKTQAGMAFGPSLALSGTYLKNSAPSTLGTVDTHDLTLSLRIPVFDGGRRLRALSEARANLESARQRERAKALEVGVQVEDALGRLKAGRAQFESGRAQRSLGEEVARVEHLKLVQGSGKVEDYLAARAQEASGEAAYWQGLYAYRGAQDYLAFVSGRSSDHD